MGRICAIIPTFNRAKYIIAALESIKRQTRPVDEIIVVNDGSTDNTLQVLKDYDDKIAVYSQTNAGKATAMNLGLSKTTADYIWIFDDDDIAADDGIAPLAAALDADPELDFAYGIHQKFPDEDLSARRMPEFWGMPGLDRPLLNIIGNFYPFQGATLVRRRLYEKVGPFRTDFPRCQDVEMTVRMVLHGKSTHVPHIIFYQRGHDGPRYVPGGQFTAEEALTRAVAFDQRALLIHKDELTLDHVTPLFAETLPEDLKQRSALLHRATLFARRAMWPQALDDVDLALQASSAPALPQDLKRLAFCVVKPQMFDLLWMDHASMRRLRRIYTASPLGKAIVAAFFSPIPWHIRNGVSLRMYRDAWRRFLLAVRILGPIGLITLVINKKLT
jgi:GT2 family glycosyltransferase